MHARNRTWLLGSDPVERCRQRTLPVEGGDGSTLSLDFTTGVLDPRLTFTRSTNATFINSQGYVEWAGGNIVPYSNEATTTRWPVTSGVTSAVQGSTDPLGGSTATRVQMGNGYHAARCVSLPGGLRYNGSIWMRRATGTGNTAIGFRMLNEAGGGVSEMVAQVNENWQRFYLPAVANPTTNNYAIGLETRNGIISGYTGNSSVDVLIWGCQLEQGDIAHTTVSTTGASKFDTPRFDYDPTSIGTPRGLLIEGSANNLLTYSEDYSQAVWTKVTVDRTTGQASPDGGTGATLVSENATTYAKHDIERTQSISAGVHTFSVWVKEPSSNSRRYVCLQLADGQSTAARYTIVADLQTGQITASGSVNGTAGAPTNTGHSITPYPGGWYRLTITMNFVSSPCYPVILLSDTSTLFGGNNQPFYSATTPYKGLIVWGAMLEQGSGASSYIPTVASTGNRAADSCYLTDFAGWSAGGNFSTTEGTLFVDQAVTFVGTANYPLGGFSTSNTAGSRFGWQYRQGDSPQGYRGLVNAGYVYEVPSGAGWSIPAGTTRFRHAMSCGGGTSAFLRQSLKSSASTGAPTQNNYSDTSTLNISGVAAFTLTQSVFTASVRIARVKYWPRAFTLAELDALTN